MTNSVETSILRPGLLVSLRTSTRGGVDYRRVDLELEHELESGAKQAKWETTRKITDATEYKAASVVRGRARTLIAGACCKSDFGMLCPSDREEELADAIRQARALARDHNATAQTTYVDVNVLVGRIAQNDAEAARSVAVNMRGLLDEMQDAIKAADVDRIRDAANRARSLGGMLTETAAEKVTAAIAEARADAREIVTKIEKASMDAGVVIASLRVKAIEEARFAFLDLDEGEVAASIAPAGRSVELAS